MGARGAFLVLAGVSVSLLSAPARLVRWLLDHPEVIVVFLVLLALWAQSFYGRQAVVQSTQLGCQRGMLDRFGDLENWYGAYLRARHTAEQQHEVMRGPGAGVDAAAAQTYLATLKDKMRRVDASHSLIWPDPRVPGAQGPYAHPLGLGTFSCLRAFPAASPLG